MSQSDKSIQEKTASLNELVAWFDSDDFVIEAAIDKFKQAETLAAEIEHDLKTVQNEVKIIKDKFDTDTGDL